MPMSSLETKPDILLLLTEDLSHSALNTGQSPAQHPDLH